MRGARTGSVGWNEYLRRMRTLLPFMWPKDDWRLQVLIMCCGLLLLAGRLVNVLVPTQYKRVVDALGGDGRPPTFAWREVLYFVGLRFLQGGGGIIASGQTFLWIPVGQYTTRQVSLKMFEHLHSLSLRFHLNRKTGEVLRVQDRGVQSIVSLLNAIVFQLAPTLVDIGVACVYFALVFDIYFASIVLATMTAYITATVAITDWRTSFRREANALDNKLEARAVDSLLNFETVKYYGAEKFEVAQYDDALVKFQYASWKSSASLNVLNSAQNVIIQAGLLVGCLVCAHRVVVGTMTVGDVVLYLSYITQLYVPLNWFGTYYRMMQRNFIDMENMLDLFQEHVEVQDLPDAAALSVGQGTVKFEDVSFGYDERQPILRGLSFTVPGGSTVAMVGESGAGKSTILRLLFRFYDVDSGRITIDGQDIRLIRQRDLRASIGVVPQDTVLFNDTIRYNIRYGKVTASDSEVEMAAEAAQIHDKILGFPDGYDTKVGERGLRLSGGEKQRVAIARTLLKASNPPIVLLDEATSALDTNTERNIQAALRRMTVNRTTIIIAHRLSTIVDADQILVMREGEIVESGTHADLMRDPDGVYYDMWMKQLQEEKEKEEAEEREKEEQEHQKAS
ncbi:P-loop containing nucleoside triphosphate hydrolase protein [Thamnocephalis sphaerospora]|uniref:P-loop containing nucleoside triphosphate hydrolase protein n=1 Tax=Thamnocephalis sphaerospora TaxID=78915 RepID=A0A4P9XPX5_9FUNG|nr:P-loop containing nucleoside triphosphate hydrolase protein [Thamnocephalis sphaerospora]|eukprot:RKP08058.1 P-loop containing nucleoside triphosphate hydrolase protein [Thamnocephalis sphaerospora]